MSNILKKMEVEDLNKLMRKMQKEAKTSKSWVLRSYAKDVMKQVGDELNRRDKEVK